VRHPVYLGLREDNLAADVVKELPDQDKERREHKPLPAIAASARISKYRWKGAVPPLRATPLRIVRASKPTR
jgi:hypothetical protein